MYAYTHMYTQEYYMYMYVYITSMAMTTMPNTQSAVEYRH